MFQGSIHPSSGLPAALAAASGVLIAVAGAPAIAAVVPPSVLPVSKRPPGVPLASVFSVTWAFLSGSWVIPVPVVVQAASVASVGAFSATISSPSVVASAVPPWSLRPLKPLYADASMLTGDGGRWGVVVHCTVAVLCWKFHDDEVGGGGGAGRRGDVGP